jgi:hypothetical protein
MSKFYVMRGPRGQLQTVTVAGREYIAVWPDMLSALRYKTRHPELLACWTVPLDRRLYEERFLSSGGQGPSFFLMAGSDPGLEIARGRVCEPVEIERELYTEVPASVIRSQAGKTAPARPLAQVA